MKSFDTVDEFLTPDANIGIAGHVNPDGDCIGSCMGLYLYIRKKYPHACVDVYLENCKEEYRFLKKTDEIKYSCDLLKKWDILFLLDTSSKDRIGVVGELLENASKTVCIDHHFTNGGFCDENCIDPLASSSSEVLYKLIDPDFLDVEIAEAIYLGIIQDSGVFQYNCTSPETMRIAAKLMETGIPFTRIVADSFFKKTFVQNKIMARALLESKLLCDDKVILSHVTYEMMDEYGAKITDLEGVINQMRNTDGVEVAIFMYQNGEGQFKVSMRSAGWVDVSRICALYGGGGHKRAAGCTLKGDVSEITGMLMPHIIKDLEGI